MNKKKQQYIDAYNKEKYYFYTFRVKKEKRDLNELLKSQKNRNEFIVSRLENSQEGILTIKQIKDRIKPVIEKYEIKEVYLFGSYSRGEATKYSDVDLLIDNGNIKSLLNEVSLTDDLKEALKKEVDVIFLSSEFDNFFKEVIERDLIKLCSLSKTEEGLLKSKNTVIK